MSDQEYFTQTTMENVCREIIDNMPLREKGRLNALLEPRYEGCDVAHRTFTLSFPCAEWMCNPVGNMHGGIIASAFDIAMGVLSIYQAGYKAMAPTVSMNIDYLLPVPASRRLVITAEITHPGRTLLQLTARAHLEDDPTRLVATASSTYYVV